MKLLISWAAKEKGEKYLFKMAEEIENLHGSKTQPGVWGSDSHSCKKMSEGKKISNLDISVLKNITRDCCHPKK
jgi:hypothetical protein